MTDSTKPRVQALAFYLPQFHPIAENDAWWGPGFTEWTNTAKAVPLYPDHYQPHVPAELGFYDLRLPEIRKAQAVLAKQHHLSAFCYWHFWFGEGRRILERPFQEVLQSGEPDFPFCLAWANESWTGTWHGAPDRVLLEQRYLGKKDDEAHFYSLLPAFFDRRYFRVGGKPFFIVYMPGQLPDTRKFTDLWNELALKEGLPGFYFVGISGHFDWDYRAAGFDNMTYHCPGTFTDNYPFGVREKLSTMLPRRGPQIYDYAKLMKANDFRRLRNHSFIPTVMPNFDNTPRTSSRGLVFQDSTPELFGKHLRSALAYIEDTQPTDRLILIQAWNEWAEGNHLEPDLKWGRGYLETLRSALEAA